MHIIVPDWVLFAVSVINSYICQNIKCMSLHKFGRRVGNTTRLIDMFVQDFFDKGECQIYDHYDTRQSKERVFYFVLRRLYIEHGLKEEDVLLDRNKLIIKRKYN